MIKTVSELLQKVIEAENVSLKKYKLKHPPTIGAMYEGFTKKWLDKLLPLQSPLYVSSGFICDETGKLSDELDCMIVTAAGEEVPHTDKKKFKVDDVVAVIQIKKSLYSTGIEEGYQNLSSVLQFTPSRMKRSVLFTDAFQSITRRPLPRREDLHKLPFEVQMIYHSLLTDFAAPARILLGYNGFKSHSNFRQSFVDYLSAQVGGEPKRGFGPTSFPSLIVCGQWSLVKANGMPFIGPLENDMFWPFYNSSSTNPIELLLQIIWTRLVYDQKLNPSVFDDDVWLQSLARFLSVKCVQLESGQQGWLYKVTTASDKELVDKEPPQRWSPVFLDLAQFVVVNRLCTEGEVDLLDSQLSDFLGNNGYTIERLVESLKQNGLAGKYDNHLELLTRGCACVILPDGRYAAGENISGQLTQWLAEYTQEHKAQQPPSHLRDPRDGSREGEA